jgi:hypothetical protein
MCVGREALGPVIHSLRDAERSLARGHQAQNHRVLQQTQSQNHKYDIGFACTLHDDFYKHVS